MKKTIIIALFGAFSVVARAQSAITLYGIVDEGFNYTNNVKGSKVYELQSGYLSGSRWGVKGVEDIGGGIKAIFQLENGFNVNNGKLGQGGLLFGRQAYLGLSSPTYGSMTLGRQYDSLVDYLSPTTANGNWAGYLFSHPYDNDNTDNTFRLNNTIKYSSVDIGGLRFGGTYSFSNDSNFANNRQYSVGASYTNGGLLLAAAYLQANNPSATANGAITSSGINGNRIRVFGAGANYKFGSAAVGFTFTNTDVENPSSSAYVGAINPTGGAASNIKFQNYEVNGRYYVTPAFLLGGMYVYTHASLSQPSGKSSPSYQTIGLMADYFMSKRTDLYLQSVYQRVGGDATGSVLDVAYVVGAANVSSNRNQFVLRAALRHKF